MEAKPRATFAFVGGRLFDGTDRDPIDDAVVLTDGERIVGAGPTARVPKPRDATVVDISGMTIMPGVIDCHVHGTYRARDMRQHLLNTPTYNILKSTEILRATIECGVTTARDMGGADAGFRAAIEEGLFPGPRLLISLVMISQTGGHGDYWVPAGLRLPKRNWLPDPVADGADEMRRLVRHVLMAGADFIKICTTGGITSVTDSWDEPQFTIEEVQVAVAEAAAKKKRVAVHAEGLAGIRTALRADVHSIEHGWFLDEQCIELMVRKGTWWVPTLALVPLSVERRRADKAWGNQQLGNEAAKDAEILAKMEDQKPLWREAVRRGVRIAMGTDQSHRLLVGENMVELQFMVEFLGMSPREALVSATSRAAACIERDDVGVIEPGRYADLVVVDGDPLSDIRILQDRARIRLVMKGGRVHRSTFH